MTVYVDVLLFINTVINYAVLSTAERMMKRNCRLWRIITGAAVGALFSFVIFSGLQSSFILFLIKGLCAFVMTFITFGRCSKAEFIKLFLCTVIISMLYCGAFILFYQLFKPPNMVIVNDIVYLQVNPLWLTALTAMVYLIIFGIDKLLSERVKSTVVSLSLRIDGREYRCIGKIDTGCNLIEPFSKAPVIIIDNSLFSVDDSLPHRIIPYTTVGGSSFLNAVKADQIIIQKKVINKEIYIASSDLNNPHYQAIINSEIVR